MTLKGFWRGIQKKQHHLGLHGNMIVKSEVAKQAATKSAIYEWQLNFCAV